MSASMAKPAQAAQQTGDTAQAESPPERYSTSILVLPTEVRLIIYRQLFSNLIVIVRRAQQEPSEGAWNVMRTCRQCYSECLPIFYDSVTIKLHHELFLYILQKKIGLQNLARIRSLVIAGFKDTVGSALAAQLPRSLTNLYFVWEGGTYFYFSTPEGFLSDDHIENLLRARRRDLDSSVKQIWSDNHKLRIYLDAYVGNAPSSKVCSRMS